MALPIRTTLEDADEICGYLKNKPTGVTLGNAKKVLDSRRLDARKISALRKWGLLRDDNDEGKLKLTPRGRDVAGDFEKREAAFVEVLKDIEPYNAIVERAAHRGEANISSLDVAAHWHDHFKSEVGSTDRIVNDQVVCFFHVLEGAGIGRKVTGRRGGATRFEFVDAALLKYVDTENKTPPAQRETVKSSGPAIFSRTDMDDVPTVLQNVAPLDSQYLQRGLLVDCYKLTDRIGTGFSAEVWKAKVHKVPVGVDLKKGQSVAIKFYTANALSIPDQVIRVEREGYLGSE